MTHRLPPPHDLEAEGVVLSALLLEPDSLAVVEPILRPTDFFSDANREIAIAIWELDATATPIDVTSVAGHLRGSGRLERVGGPPYLATLLDGIPATAHLEEHARTVASAARIRRVQAVCQTVAAEGYSALRDAPTWLQTVEARVMAATDTWGLQADTLSTLATTVPVEFAGIQERASGKVIAGRPTRIAGLDRILRGLVDAVPYVVAGRPGHGKTALGWQIAEGIAVSGDLVVFLSQEMPRAQLTQRAIAQSAGIEPDKIRSGQLNADEWNSVANAVQFVSKLPIAIDERSGHTGHTARSAVRRGLQKLRGEGHRGRLGLVVLDYVQIMADHRRGDDSRSTAVGEIMRALTQLAKEFGCPVLVLSQLNREIDKRPDKRPKLSDLGESGSIEQDAYGVIFLYREDCYRDPAQHDGMADVIVAKHRNGKMGTARMRYLPSTTFATVADEWDEAGDEAGRRYP